MAPNLDASLVAEDATPAGQLRKLNATFKAVPISSGSDAMRRIQLSGDARASGLALKDPALAKAVGTEVSSVLRGTSTTNGVVYFDTLELKLSTVQGRFTGRAGSSDVSGRRRRRAGSCEVRRRGRAPSQGAASVIGTIEGTPRANRFSAKIDGHATRFATTAVRPQMASLEVELELT